ncbi:hypothetical protein [Paenibacillus xylanexedens]|uniref:hypothetical protein n=1 Tax=Paenibacillus xylanexedens TaxID=528191 RepID=UPI000F536C66|nr:hypothetical protein [Paenibacillus xylanexedens]
MNNVEQIVRRKAKRIVRARELLSCLKFDIEYSSLNETDKQYLFEQIDGIKKVLTNNDKTDSEFNT